VVVKRDDRDFLLKIRNGEFEFDELMRMVEAKMEQIKQLYKVCTLPDKPDAIRSETLLINIREQFYNR
jgi:hypothetical protein